MKTMNIYKSVVVFCIAIPVIALAQDTNNFYDGNTINGWYGYQNELQETKVYIDDHPKNIQTGNGNSMQMERELFYLQSVYQMKMMEKMKREKNEQKRSKQQRNDKN